MREVFRVLQACLAHGTDCVRHVFPEGSKNVAGRNHRA